MPPGEKSLSWLMMNPINRNEIVEEKMKKHAVQAKKTTVRAVPAPLETALKTRGTGVERLLPTLRVIQTPRQARAWLGLSLAEVGREVARLTGRKRAYDKTTVMFWERTRITAAEVRQAYATLMANRLTTLLGRTIGVKLVANSPWHISAWTQCATCDQWFELHRRSHKRCPQCVLRR